MSDPSTIPPVEGSAATADSASAPASEAHAGPGKGFEEVRKKIADQLSELGHHVDGLSQKLTDAAGQARQVIERELSNLKTQHPEAFARLDELRHTGDESLDVLRSRLDKLAGDLEKAVGGFLSSIAEQAKKATKPHVQTDDSGAEKVPEKSADQNADQNSTQAAPPAASDKPQS